MRISDWSSDVCSSDLIPNSHFSSAQLPVNVLNGAFRGPCYNSHAFFVESFIDDCAIAAGIDPLEYRLKLLSTWDKPWSDCLRLAAEKIVWGKPLPKSSAERRVGKECVSTGISRW